MPSTSRETQLQIPLIYRLFFLFIEPVSAILGAYYPAFNQETYLKLLSSSADVKPLSPTDPTAISLLHLANLYLLFALNEALVLRSSTSLRTWRTLLFCLLIADFGHLYTMKTAWLGMGVYWKVWMWNAMDWGSVGFVYAGAGTRIAFLLGIGLQGATRQVVKDKGKES